MGLFDKLKAGLKKTRDSLGSMLQSVFSGGKKVDEALLEELEEVLILADVGVECTTRVMEQLRKTIKEQKLEQAEDVRNALKQILKDMMAKPAPRQEGSGPMVVLIIGVNGVGKTTTIGKLAAMWKRQGKKVLLAAGDTFRAAAADQLAIWAERAGVDIVGISNFLTFLKNTQDYRRDLRRVEYGDERDEAMRAFLEKISPTAHASEIRKPLFVVQGQNDPRVPVTEASQMVVAVRQGGTPVWYLLAKDEGHGFRKKPNVDFFREAMVQFWQKYLIGP